MQATMHPGVSIGAGRPATMRALAFALLLFAMLAMWTGVIGKAFAAPAVETAIGNQANATYNDGSGPQTSNSNQVTTYVLPVGAYTLTAPRTVTAAPGTTVYQQHTLTNTGNVPLSFNLTTTNYILNGDAAAIAVGPVLNDTANGGGNNPATFNFSSLLIAPDNGSGGPSGAPTATLATPSIPAGGTFTFVVASQVPAGATNGNIDEYGITATPASTTYTGPFIGAVSIPFANGGTSYTNEDRVTVSTAGVIQVTKAISLASGPSPSTNANPTAPPTLPVAPATGQIRITLTYTNTGTTAVNNVQITDTIGTGNTAGFCYVDTSGRWSDLANGTTALTDPVDAAVVGASAATILFDATNTGQGLACTVAQVVSATISTVAPNVTGSVSFTVTVKSGQAPGIATTRNSANYNPLGGPPNTPTNEVTYRINPTYATSANNSITDSTIGGGAQGLTPGTGGDLVPPNGIPFTSVLGAHPGVPQGSTQTFNNIIWNRGNTVDTFNISLGAIGGVGQFPAGTAVTLLQQDGVNNLTGNQITIPAPGAATCVAPYIQATPVTAGCGYRVVTRAQFPAGYNDPAPAIHDLVKTSTSVNDPSQSDTVTDRVGQILAATADLANGDTALTLAQPFPVACTVGAQTVAGTTAAAVANNCGIGTSGAAVVTTYTMNRGSSAVFRLAVQNNSTSADNFNLTYGEIAANASNNALPTATAGLPGAANYNGWTVQFRADGGAGNCSTMGANITNTGNINGNGGVAANSQRAIVCAVVALPSNGLGANSGTYDLFFRITSPVTGATDTKRDQIIINQVRALDLTTNRMGDVFPGGTVVYEHTLTNNGNVLEGSTAATDSAIAIALNTPTAGWTTTVYVDTNNNGIFDGADALLASSIVGDTLVPFATATTGVAGSGLGDGLSGLAPGESVRLFVRVQAPAGAASGTTENTIISATTTNDAGTGYTSTVPPVVANTDITRVVAGQLRVTKEQALDDACSGVPNVVGGLRVVPPPAGFTTANLTQAPGRCILYRIVAANQGVAPATCVVINDATPPTHTRMGPLAGHQATILTPPHAGVLATNITGPAAGLTGAIQSSCTTAACHTGAATLTTVPAVCAAPINGFTLAPGQSTTVQFGVQVNP